MTDERHGTEAGGVEPQRHGSLPSTHPGAGSGRGNNPRMAKTTCTTRYSGRVDHRASAAVHACPPFQQNHHLSRPHRTSRADQLPATPVARRTPPRHTPRSHASTIATHRPDPHEQPLYEPRIDPPSTVAAPARTLVNGKPDRW